MLVFKIVESLQCILNLLPIPPDFYNSAKFLEWLIWSVAQHDWNAFFDFSVELQLVLHSWKKILNFHQLKPLWILLKNCSWWSKYIFWYCMHQYYIFVVCSDPISCIIFYLFIFILIDKKLITSYQKVHIYSFYSYLYIANKNDNNITKSNDNNYI